jgi:biopolymer transport protein TolQ
VDLSITSLITSSDLISKTIITVLLLCSIWSWAVFFLKIQNFGQIKKKMRTFENIFWSGQIIDDLYERVRRNVDNPLTLVFVNALDETKKSSNNQSRHNDLLKLSYKERVLIMMNLAKNREIEKLSIKIGSLATIASCSPFVGLLGTVWGIMHSFQSIAASKNTTLAVVAPGIAEALFTTALGLFVAIPATLIYNYLSAELDNIADKIEDFIGELSTLISRAIDDEKM